MHKTNITKKLSILQVLPAMMSGGVEREVLDIANALAKLKHRSFVASSGGELVRLLYDNGSLHFNLPLHSKNPFVIVKNIFKLKKIIKFYNIDIIHAQSRAPAWSSYFAAKLTGCKFVTTLHGVHSVKGPCKKLYNSIMTKGEIVIAVSEFIANYAKDNYKFEHEKLRVIHCGTDIDKFNYKNIDDNRLIQLANNLNIPTDKRIIMLAARFSRNKGHLFLLEALNKLPKNSFTCLFVGNYSGHLKYYNELQTKINEYNLNESVIMTGNIMDMPAIYALSDIIISASITPESFGLTSIEAQAMGKMIIATDLGGIRETIIPNETGWLVKPGDAEDLSSTINNALSIKPKELLKHATKARTNIEKNFSLEKMTEKIIKCYIELI